MKSLSLEEAAFLYGPDIRSDRRDPPRYPKPRVFTPDHQPRIVVYPYRCGFNPRGKHLAEVVAHWRRCTHQKCREMLANHLELKDYFRQKFGHRALPRSYDMESRMIPETNESTQR